MNMSNKEVNIPKRILFVDDEENVLRSLKRLFVSEDYEVFTAASGSDGLAVLKEIEVPVIVSDQRMPVMTGAEFLGKSRQFSPDAVRIILTGYADVEAAIGAINTRRRISLCIKAVERQRSSACDKRCI